MRRHWLTTLLAYLCFATAAAELYGLCLLLLKPGAASNAPLYTVIWRILGLFPSPTSIFLAANIVLRFVAPAMVQSRTYSVVFAALVLVFCVMLGLAILRLRPWGRLALVAICALTAALQAFTLYQLVSYSPGLLAVLNSNYRGASSSYVSGAGPGAILASLAVSIAVLRLLLRDGLPFIAPHGSEPAAVLRASTGSAQASAKAQKAHKFFLVAIASALVIEVFFLLSGYGSGPPNTGTTRFLLAVLIAPHVLILGRSWRGPDRFSLGFAAGYGLIVAYIGAIFLPSFLFGLAWIVSSPSSGSILSFSLLGIFPLIQLCVAVSAIIITRSLPPPRPNSAVLGLWGLAFLIPIVVGTAGPQFFSDWQRGVLRVPGVKSGGDELKDLMNREVAARDLVHAYGNCAFLYAKLHPDTGFPENAMQMGPGGIKCLTKEQAAGNPEGYSFRYSAAKSSGSTHFDRFTAAAQMNSSRQFSAALMDEKGIFVLGDSAEYQPQIPSADQISWNTPGMYKRTWFNEYHWMLPRIAACATQMRNQSPDSQFPATLAAILSVKLNPKDPDCLKVFTGPDPILQSAANSNQVAYGSYLLDYAPERDGSGKILHFHVTLRPRHYAEEGVRSYFMDDSGVIHATSEDRAATSKDPESLACEGGGVCEDASTP